MAKVHPNIYEKLTPAANLDPQTEPQWSASEESIDLWAYSLDMTQDGNDDGKFVPYVKDNEGNTYYLQKIEWRNSTSSNEATVGTIMDSDDIIHDANEGNKNYSFNPSTITADPYSGSYELWAPDYSSVEYINYTVYYIYYHWTSTPPDQWGGTETPLQIYSIEYDLNLPNDLTNQKIYPVRTDGSMDIGNTGLTENGLKEEINKYQKSVKENLNFTIAQGGQYKDYLVFGDEGYYAFAGWKDECEYVHETQDETCTVQATAALAGEDNKITLTAQWELFYPTNSEQPTEAQKDAAGKIRQAEEALVNDENSFKIGVLERDKEATNENVLLTQWSSVDGEPDRGEYSGDTIYLDKTETIHYRVSATVDSSLTSFAQDSEVKNFAQFKIALTVDKNLEFANVTDGKASFIFNCPFLMPTETNISDATISDTTDENGNYTITFSPSDVQKDASGNTYITVTAQWIPKTYPSTETTLRQPMTLDNLVFQLKDAVQTQDSQLQTSADVTANIDLTKTGEFRTLYQKARSLLTTSPNDAWSNIFGEPGDPVAVALAAEFLNSKLENYNLSQDTKAVLDANTATATVIQSEPVKVKPADITVYEGGNGGYDAVVDGTETTISNSLPHPMFHITAPDGVDPKDLTFINGDKSWTVISDGNDYYHFSEGDDQDKVRVTYSYEDKDGVTHTVTEDAFDPATMGDVYGKLTIELYPGENNLSQVTAQTADGRIYRLSVGTGTLTVRAVQEDDATSAIEETAPAQKVSSGNAVAVAPAGTTYTLNNTGVKLPEGHCASLLFDDIISSDDKGDERISKLQEAVDTKLGGANENRKYQIKYLDLVDANNGNAWIKASNPVTIYWGYPEGTGQSTDFKLLHFKDLHRDTSGGGNTGFDPDDIADSTIEEITVNNNANGISFTVGSGGFSPFVLVWTEASAPGPDPTPDPDPEPTPDPDEPGIADPDDTGVADWLNTEDHEVFLNGYPDGSFGPDRSMTRAEVAAMFSNLLLDKNVPITTSFSDVAEDAWYADAVNMLASLDMIAGYEDGTFRPDAPITRAEFTAIAMRFADATPEGENIFSDVHAGDWFYDVVVGSIQYGWIGGYEDGTFRPQNTITRAEVTAITNRMLGRVADEAFIDAADELRSFGDLSDAHWAYYSIMEATNAHDYTTSDGVEEWEALH